jgi:Xaa-Pro aminopeptidase
MPLYKEEEDMTKEQTQTMINEAMEAQKPAAWNKLEDVPDWGRATVKKLMERKILNGTGSGLGLNFDQLRILVLNDRAGLYGG